MSDNCQYEQNVDKLQNESMNNSQLLVATGCSLNHSWMGGFSCHQSLFPDLSLPDYKWIGAGGFGGGGGGCKGGGGGGGFIGRCQSQFVSWLSFLLFYVLLILYLLDILSRTEKNIMKFLWNIFVVL